VNTMGSKVVSFRIPDDLWEGYEQRCTKEGVAPQEKLRHFVDEFCYPQQAEDTPVGETEETLEAKVDELTARVEALEHAATYKVTEATSKSAPVEIPKPEDDGRDMTKGKGKGSMFDWMYKEPEPKE
jgi:hypothetical protein